MNTNLENNINLFNIDKLNYLASHHKQLISDIKIRLENQEFKTNKNEKQKNSYSDKKTSKSSTEKKR